MRAIKIVAMLLLVWMRVPWPLGLPQSGWNVADDESENDENNTKSGFRDAWTANKTKCLDCCQVIDAAGQCDCDYDPLWWDTPNRRGLPTNTKANISTQNKHIEGLQSCETDGGE